MEKLSPKKSIVLDENNFIFQLVTNFINQTSEHLFLTGKAGTGKTTFLKYIRQATTKQTIVVAPTGVAAINAEGVTLHSLFQLPFEPYIPGYSNPKLQKRYFRFSNQKQDMLRNLELLIIDEVSMLRADTLDAIDESLRSIRHNTQPFGGIQILYIGDLLQLPPVAKKDEWDLLKNYYQSPFFFHAFVIKQIKPIYLELKKVYRQNDSTFINLLNRIRNNLTTNKDIQHLESLYNPNFIPSRKDNFITLTTHNYKADNINNAHLTELPGKEHIFMGQVQGDFPKSSLPTEINLRLKKNAQIMFIKNDTQEPRRYYNGKIANIIHIEGNCISVRCPETNKEIRVGKEKWENILFFLNKETKKIEEKKLGTFIQYPIRLAWAVTIHKSQGLTFKKAIIDAGMSFTAGQIYVALSRCIALEGIVLHSRIHRGCISVNSHVVKFCKNEPLEEDLQLLFRNGKRKFFINKILLYFDWRLMDTVVRKIERSINEEENGEIYQSVKLMIENFRQKVKELEIITVKLQRQLKLIINQKGTNNNNVSPIKEHVWKTFEYYNKIIATEILLPLQNCISEIQEGNSKRQTVLKTLKQAEKNINDFLEKIKCASLNEN